MGDIDLTDVALAILVIGIVVTIGANILINYGDAVSVLDSSESTFIYTAPTFLTPINRGITSSEVKANNQTWLDFDGVRNKVILNSELGGAWSWFSTPLSVFHNGATYTGYVNANGDIIVNKYIDSTASISTFTLNTSLEYDDHAAPTILIRPDRKLMIFYTKHGVGPMKYRISTNPEDISAFDDEIEISGTNGVTYNNPIYLEVENLTYLFYRQVAGSGFDPSFRTFNESSWSAETVVFSTPGERPYARYATNDNDTIWFAFTDGHPNDVVNNSIYSFYYKNDSTTGQFYYANGTVIGTKGDLPFVMANLTFNTSQVYNASVTGERAWIWDIKMDEDDNPHILYSIVENVSEHYYRYARYNVSEDLWDNFNITIAGPGLYFGENEYSGGLSFDTKNMSIVYLSKFINSVYEMQKWITNDGGNTWTNSSNITSNSNQYNIRPVSPKNHSNEINVSWMHGSFSEFTNYYTEIKTETINLSPTDNLPILNNFSISVWAKWGGVTRSSEETIYSDWIGNSDFRQDRSILLRWDSQDEKMFFNVELSGGSEASQSFTDMNLTDKEWHHLVAMFNGTNIVMYMDGVISPTIGAASGNLETPNTLTSFGYAGFNKGDTFNGSLDNLKVYNKSLNATEVSTIYNFSRNTSVLDPNSITDYLNFNENSGLIAHDLSINSNNATITGATWATDGALKTLTAITDYTINTATGLFTIVNNDYNFNELITTWSYNSDRTDGDLANDAAAGLGEFGNWFSIIVIVGIAGVILTLIFIAFGNRKEEGGQSY